jgi:hypothetical protein
MLPKYKRGRIHSVLPKERGGRGRRRRRRRRKRRRQQSQNRKDWQSERLRFLGRLSKKKEKRQL